MSKSIIEYFYDKEKDWADRPYLNQPFGAKWETLSYKEVGDQARRLASWMKKKCGKEKAHVSVVSRNCREWVISDLAIMMAGYVSVPFYANLSGKQLNEVISLGDVDLLLFGKLDGWEDMKTGVPEGLPVGRFPHYEGNPRVDVGEEWSSIMSENEPLEGNPIPAMEDMWSIIFTSGTTGTPKGVVFKHQKAADALLLKSSEYWIDVDHDGNNRFFSFLPLNHIAERNIMLIGIRYGCQTFFSENLNTFAKNLQDARPTAFFAVPRIWTKFRQGILNKMPQKRLDMLLGIPVVNNIIRKKLKTALGLDQAKVCITGAAPMTVTETKWWLKLGIPLSDAYGQTENFAFSNYSPVGKVKPGSVGIAHDGVDIRIDPDTDEIQTRSALNLNGYYKDPEKTAETIQDNWLNTGDAGRIDEDGYLFITGRVKDTFKTEKGQFIVPAKVENMFGDNSDIEQMCLLGLGMPHPIMVVVPSEMGSAKPQPELEESLSTTLQSVNAKLPNYTRVGTMVVSNTPFTPENGLMTPTLKVKRFNMHKKYAENLRNLCEDSRTIIWED